MNQWEPGESGNPLGRPKMALKQLAEKAGVDFQVHLTRTDKTRILESMMEMTMGQLKSIATDPRAPAFMVVIATAIKGDIKSGSFRTIDMLMDRFYGRAVQAIAVMGTPPEAAAVPLSEWTDTEIDEELARLDNIEADYQIEDAETEGDN